MLHRSFATAKKRNLYDILDVHEDASASQIKRAFLELAKQYHPDKNKTKEAKNIFAEINEAYETLSDDQKRGIYDATGMSSNDQ